MDFSHYGDDTVQIAVDLVNTPNRVNGDDQLTTVSELRAFLDRYPETWGGPFKGKLASRHLEEVLELRQSLRAVFEANDAGDAADGLNRIIADSGTTPLVSAHEGDLHLHYEAADGSVGKHLGAATAMGLATVLVHNETLALLRAGPKSILSF